MKLSRFVYSLVILLIVGGFAIWFIFPAPQIKLLDVVSVNDVVKTAESNWTDLTLGDSNKTDIFSGIKCSFDYAIIDKNGNTVYMTKPDLRVSWTDVIEHQDTLADIEVDGNRVGKIIFYNDTVKLLSEYQQRLKLICLVILGVIAICCVGFTFLLEKTVLRPFHKLQEFAQQVASGNLSVPLIMDKQNLFGPFTESFDLMRTELAKAREKERRANQSKKEMIAALSHDIRTPVASIKAVAELMLVTEKDEKSHKNLTAIVSKSDQISLLVNNLLHSTMDDLHELNVKSTVESSLLLPEMIHSADYRNLMIPFNIPECLLSIDLTRIQQIFDNLLSNSYKYANTKIELSAYFEQGCLVLVFQDYGPGVEKDELPFLTNRYYQGKNAEGNTGVGLGLYLSNCFIQQMGGNLTCMNTQDGFTVSLSLPLA